MFLSVFFQSGNRGFDGNRLISPEPAFIFTRKAFRSYPTGKRRITSKGRFPIFDYQYSPVEELTTRSAGVSLTTDTFAFVDDHFDGLFFEMHKPIPP